MGTSYGKAEAPWRKAGLKGHFPPSASGKARNSQPFPYLLSLIHPETPNLIPEKEPNARTSSERVVEPKKTYYTQDNRSLLPRKNKER